MKTDEGRIAEIKTFLRQLFPHGHEHFTDIVVEQAQLHSDKNHDYALGGPPLGNFDRVAAILSNYPNLKLSDPKVVTLVYIMKQFDAVLWGLNSNIEHKVEGLAGRLNDISVYTKLIMCMLNDEKVRKEFQHREYPPRDPRDLTDLTPGGAKTW